MANWYSLDVIASLTTGVRSPFLVIHSLVLIQTQIKKNTVKIIRLIMVPYLYSDEIGCGKS